MITQFFTILKIPVSQGYIRVKTEFFELLILAKVHGECIGFLPHIYTGHDPEIIGKGVIGRRTKAIDNSAGKITQSGGAIKGNNQIKAVTNAPGGQPVVFTRNRTNTVPASEKRPWRRQLRKRTGSSRFLKKFQTTPRISEGTTLLYPSATGLKT